MVERMLECNLEYCFINLRVIFLMMAKFHLNSKSKSLKFALLHLRCDGVLLCFMFFLFGYVYVMLHPVVNPSFNLSVELCPFKKC